VQERVRFEQGNLLAAKFLSGVASYDVIFCRNVLIYFDAPTQERVIKTLDRLLAPDGFLFFGPAEASLARAGGFISANQQRAFAYRKTSVLAREPASIREISPKKIKPSPRKFVAKLRPKIERQSPPVAPVVADILESARRLADAGKLREAAKACEAHLRERGTSRPRSIF
jgi:chemotaxis protein methyltransferase WspC